MILLPQKSGQCFHVDSMLIAGWERVYKNVNVRAELEKMRQWLEANPKRRKVNTHAFVVNWLNRASETKPGVSGHTAYRERVQAEHHKEMAKPVASPEVGRAALNEALKILGQSARVK